MSVAWTDEEIGAATPFPKPRGAIERSMDPEENLDLLHRVLRHIANHADLLEGPPLPLIDADFDHRGQWLVVPLTEFVLEALAMFEANLEDIEGDVDREPDQDDEPSLGTTAAITQTEANVGRDQWNVDCELDRCDDEPDHDGEVVTWEHWTPDPPGKASLPVYASREVDRPRACPKVPADPITHPVLGVYRRIY